MNQNDDEKRLIAKQAGARFQLANAWQLKGNLDAAITGYLQVLRLDPDHARANIQLGTLMMQNGSTERALEYYERAFSLSPDDEDIGFMCDYVRDLRARASERISLGSTALANRQLHLAPMPASVATCRSGSGFHWVYFSMLCQTSNYRIMCHPLA